MGEAACLVNRLEQVVGAFADNEDGDVDDDVRGRINEVSKTLLVATNACTTLERAAAKPSSVESSVRTKLDEGAITLRASVQTLQKQVDGVLDGVLESLRRNAGGGVSGATGIENAVNAVSVVSGMVDEAADVAD